MHYIKCQCGCDQLVPTHTPPIFHQAAPIIPSFKPPKKVIDYGAQYDFRQPTPSKTVTYYYNR